MRCARRRRGTGRHPSARRRDDLASSAAAPRFAFTPNAPSRTFCAPQRARPSPLRGPVPDSLGEKLQSSLGTAYTITRELGGGGTSRVFVADEEALGRRVVVKVVAPELAEGMSAERFAREVKLAARLQHANIVPVLSAGVTG